MAARTRVARAVRGPAHAPVADTVIATADDPNLPPAAPSGLPIAGLMLAASDGASGALSVAQSASTRDAGPSARTFSFRRSAANDASAARRASALLSPTQKVILHILRFPRGPLNTEELADVRTSMSSAPYATAVALPTVRGGPARTTLSGFSDRK